MQKVPYLYLLANNEPITDSSCADTSAVSYFHLALKMLAVGDYERSLSLMQMTLRVDKWNKMNYWGVAVLSILVSKTVHCGILFQYLVYYISYKV